MRLTREEEELIRQGTDPERPPRNKAASVGTMLLIAAVFILFVLFGYLIIYIGL